MTLAFSEAERAALYSLFARSGAWGGSEGILLAQDDLYRLLNLAQFEGLEKLHIPDLSFDLVDVDIPDECIEVLRQMIIMPGQHPNCARIVVGILRRLKAARASA